MMVAYSFKGRFRAPILAGIKRQTIRGSRRRHARPGEELQLYVGMRTKQCELIARRMCIAVQDVQIWPMADIIMTELRHPAFQRGDLAYPDAFAEFFDDGVPLKSVDLDHFAELDGFDSWLDMKKFWLEQHPEASSGPGAHFNGCCILWSGP